MSTNLKAWTLKKVGTELFFYGVHQSMVYTTKLRSLASEFEDFNSALVAVEDVRMITGEQFDVCPPNGTPSLPARSAYADVNLVEHHAFSSSGKRVA